MSGAKNASLCALGASLVLLASVSKADVAIEWTGATGCADGGPVESEIARLLPDHAGSTLHAVVEVTHAETWNASVRLEDGDTTLGERTFEAGSCAELQGAVALLVVLAVDPNALLAMPAETESNTPSTPNEELEADEANGDTRSEAARSEAASALGHPEQRGENNEDNENSEAPNSGALQSNGEVDEHAPQTRREIVEPAHWGVAARGGVDVGALPAPSPVFSLGIFHQRSRFGLGVYAFTVLPQDAATTLEASGRMALGAVRATPGLRLRFRRLVLDLRGVVELGVMGGRGRDVGGAQTGYSLWAALGLEAGIAIRIGPFSLGFRGDLRMPLNRPVYAFVGPLRVHQASSLVGRGEIALGLHFL